MSEIVLTLLLSLRFISLVFDEVRRLRGLTSILMCDIDNLIILAFLLSHFMLLLIA